MENISNTLKKIKEVGQRNRFVGLRYSVDQLINLLFSLDYKWSLKNAIKKRFSKEELQQLILEIEQEGLELFEPSVERLDKLHKDDFFNQFEIPTGVVFMLAKQGLSKYSIEALPIVGLDLDAPRGGQKIPKWEFVYKYGKYGYTDWGSLDGYGGGNQKTPPPISNI